MKLQYFFGCILAAASLAVCQRAVWHTGVEAVMAGEAAVTDFAGEVEDTFLSVVVTDSVALTRLADSPGAASVQDSGGRGNFSLFWSRGSRPLW
jgi:hypothetical protein